MIQPTSLSYTLQWIFNIEKREWLLSRALPIICSESELYSLLEQTVFKASASGHPMVPISHDREEVPSQEYISTQSQEGQKITFITKNTDELCFLSEEYT